MEQNLTIGAHVVTPRWGYVHHGIYAGGGRVIHYAGFKQWYQRGPVEEISLDEFGGGRGIGVKAWAAPKFTGADVVARAKSRIGENHYRLFANNCEHFAEWSITGMSRSRQVEALKQRVLRSVGMQWIARTGSKNAVLAETV